jgi:hypothetical protein
MWLFDLQLCLPISTKFALEHASLVNKEYDWSQSLNYWRMAPYSSIELYWKYSILRQKAGCWSQDLDRHCVVNGTLGEAQEPPSAIRQWSPLIGRLYWTTIRAG